jgi:hypothetical protein
MVLGLLLHFQILVIFYVERLSVPVLTPKLEDKVSVSMISSYRMAQVFP